MNNIHQRNTHDHLLCLQSRDGEGSTSTTESKSWGRFYPSTLIRKYFEKGEQNGYRGGYKKPGLSLFSAIFFMKVGFHVPAFLLNLSRSHKVMMMMTWSFAP